MTTDPRTITRPDDSLLTYYLLVSLCALLAFSDRESLQGPAASARASEPFGRHPAELPSVEELPPQKVWQKLWIVDVGPRRVEMSIGTVGG